MEFTTQQISDLVKGQVLGDSNIKLLSISKIESGEPNSLSFLANERYVKYLQNTKSSAVLISENLVPNYSVNTTLIVVPDANIAFNELLKFYAQYRYNVRSGIDKTVDILENVVLGKDCYIGKYTIIEANSNIGNSVQIYPHCFIGENVKIGSNTKIYPNVQILSDTIIGENCVIQSGTVIGSEGFGYIPTSTGIEFKPHLGNVLIEDDVHIGANCTIDRAVMGSTIVGKGTKIDNLIQIAHNVVIGKNNFIAAQVGIAGSAIIGDLNQIGGQAGIAGHLKIGNNVSIQAQSGINRNIEDNSQVFGAPAIDANQFRKSYVYFRKFPEIIKRIEAIEKSISKDE